ncbi:cold shock CspA family protein [Nocardia sp. GP40]|uniref:cold-shock protein n=1 Tax=Nocardia sp. GP40 TaxID=3156268 RepID=UPI003D21F59E
MPIGFVKWFDDKKGIGFIAQTDPDAPDLFVHHSNIMGRLGHKSLLTGERVEFEVDRSPQKGPQAVAVCRRAAGAADPRDPAPREDHQGGAGRSASSDTCGAR